MGYYIGNIPNILVELDMFLRFPENLIQFIVMISAKQTQL